MNGGDDLLILAKDALDKGFCSLLSSHSEAEDLIGKKITLNKLGVIVKEKDGKRNARVIWDLKESGVNSLCSQGERILLPKLSDVGSDVVDIYHSGGRPRFLAVDIRDALHI